jgi:hypothetical protein
MVALLFFIYFTFQGYEAGGLAIGQMAPEAMFVNDFGI